MFTSFFFVPGKLNRRDTVVILDLFLCGELHIFYDEVFGCGPIALRVHSRDLKILKSYVGQMIVFFVCLHIEIRITFKAAVSDRQIISPRYRQICPYPLCFPPGHARSTEVYPDGT